MSESSGTKRRAVSSSLVGAACGVLLLACGGHYESSADPSAGAMAGATQTSNFLLGAPLPYHGTVQFGWDGIPATTTANATFSSPTMTMAFEAIPSCTPTQTAGPCQMFDCESGPTTSTAPQAGPIRISDGQSFNAWLQADDSGAYSTFFVPGNALPDSALVTVSAPGAEVPAFSGTVRQPRPLAIDGPLAMQAAAGTLPWDPNQDLTLTFQGGAADVELIVYSVSDFAHRLICEFPTLPGTATLPASLLSQVPRDSESKFIFFTGSGVRLSAGDYKVDILAYVPVLTLNTNYEFQVVPQ